MATVVSSCFTDGRHLVFGKTAANFTEISRKRVFTTSNRNKIENRV